jgi:hypothetical protein
MSMLLFFKRLHRFLAGQSFYPLVMATLLALAIFCGRVLISRRVEFRLLVWNLFLAWLPYGLSMVAAGLHRLFPRRWGLLLAPGLAWLVFFPNAPYIVTDLYHLEHRPPVLLSGRGFVAHDADPGKGVPGQVSELGVRFGDHWPGRAGDLPGAVRARQQLGFTLKSIPDRQRAGRASLGPAEQFTLLWLYVDVYGNPARVLLDVRVRQPGRRINIILRGNHHAVAMQEIVRRV